MNKEIIFIHLIIKISTKIINKNLATKLNIHSGNQSYMLKLKSMINDLKLALIQENNEIINLKIKYYKSDMNTNK